MVLAHSYDLSSYGAVCLEFAIRESLTLASLDRALVKVAEKAGVSIYLKEGEGKCVVCLGVLWVLSLR